MERDTLSFRQLMAILWTGLMGPAVELLPGYSAQAGGMGTLAVLIAGLIMLISGLAFWRAAQGSESLADGLVDAFGGVAGKLILFIYIMWGEVLLTVRLRQSAQRLLGNGQRDGAVWFFLVVLGLMALWLARGHLGAFGRTGELMFVAVLLTGGVVLALALFQVRSENLLADWDWSLDGAFRVALPGMSALGYGIFAAFLVQPQGMDGVGAKWLGWTVMGCLVLVLAQIIMVGNFGPELTGRLSSPFFQLAKSVGIEGAFQRVESVVAAIWTFSDLVLLGGILWGIRRIADILWPKAPPNAVTTTLILVAMVAALAVFGERLAVEDVAYLIIPIGNLILATAVPVCAIGIKWGIKKNK